jgi:hypothetical protein
LYVVAYVMEVPWDIVVVGYFFIDEGKWPSFSSMGLSNFPSSVCKLWVVANRWRR